MPLRRLLPIALSVVAMAVAITARGQTSAASGTVILLPQIATIAGGWVTTVFVQNPNGTPIVLDVTYQFSDNADPAVAGTPLTCDQLSIAANAAITFDPAVRCHLSTLYPGVANIFGTLTLSDATTQYKTNMFYAYSRAAQTNPAGAGNGFSVEGFPIGNFSSATSDAIGLARTSTFPNYLSNCFVDALGEQVDYQIILRQGETGALLGTYPQSGPPLTLAPYHTARVFDVLTAAGAPPGDYSNVRATFVNSDNSAMIGFCTVETTGTGSADFRIAKSIDARDVRQARQVCYGVGDCTTPLFDANSTHLNSILSKNIHYTIFDQPDFVGCSLISDTPAHLADLEIMLRAPGDPQTAPQFVPTAPYATNPPYTAGGPGATSFYVYTGEKSTQALGATTRWYIDVSFNATNPSANASDVTTGSGVPYAIACTAGNGMSVPWLGTTGPANP